MTDDFEASGCAHAGERVGDESGSSARPRNDSAAVERDRGVVGLVRAVQREEHVVVRRVRRVEVDDAVRRPRVGSRARRSRCRARSDRRRARAPGRSGRARDRSRRARALTLGSTMPAFSAAMSASVGPMYSTWSMLTLVTTATSASTTLVASPVPPRPTSTTATSTATSPNHAQRRGGEDLEVARARRGAGPRPRPPRPAARRAPRRGSGSPFQHDALVDPGEVGAGVGAHREPGRLRAARGHAGHRRLAVGAGEVDHRVLELRASPAARMSGRSRSTASSRLPTGGPAPAPRRRSRG